MASLLNKKVIITHNFQVILHAQDAVETTAGSVVIRSPSADTDIFVILSLFYLLQEHIWSLGLESTEKDCGLKRSKSVTTSRSSSLVSMRLQGTTMFHYSLGIGNGHVAK